MIAERRSRPVRVAELAPLMRLLSDPIRLEILLLLSRGECCVCDLVEAIGASQPLLSHHLGALRRSGLVRDRKAGRWIYYRLVSEKFEPVALFLERLERPGAYKTRQDCDSAIGSGPTPGRSSAGRRRSARITEE